MSDIQVINASSKTYSHLGRYFFAELSCGKHSVLVEVAPKHLQVLVQNAMHRAWRGMGRQFANLEAALAWYKTPEIRSMVSAAVELARDAAELEEAQRVEDYFAGYGPENATA